VNLTHFYRYAARIFYGHFRSVKPAPRRHLPRKFERLEAGVVSPETSKPGCRVASAAAAEVAASPANRESPSRVDTFQEGRMLPGETLVLSSEGIPFPATHPVK